jgi:nicotinate-nucleotide pyrophosphorylase (carboxylating)
MTLFSNKIIKEAFNEDAVRFDITTQALIPANQISRAHIIFKEEGVVCGIEGIKTIFRTLDKNVRLTSYVRDGARVKKNTKIVFLQGKTRAILTGERTALNFLSHLSGIATTTARYVKSVRPYRAKIVDTRKTTPGLRALEKYAVRCGGGVNHRADLQEVMMIKDNHKLFLPPNAWTKTIQAIRQQTKKPIIIEVDNLLEFKEALTAKPDIILLDNMKPQTIRKAIQLKKKNGSGKKPLLEASGGINIANVRSIARTGVDRISIGALTHSSQAVDVSLELIR